MAFKEKDILAKIKSLEERLKTASPNQIDHINASLGVWEDRLKDSVTDADSKKLKGRVK